MMLPTSSGWQAGLPLDADGRVSRARGGAQDEIQDTVQDNLPGNNLPGNNLPGNNLLGNNLLGDELLGDTVTAGRTAASDQAVARALEAAIRDADRVADLLDVLSDGRLWVPLPDDGRPVTDGSSLTLPTVRYLGSEFVPAFTSPDELVSFMTDPADGPPPVVPHVIVPAAELARSLPADMGIALNPGAEASVPVYPAGVAHLAGVQGQAEGVRIRLSEPPAESTRLLGAARAQLRSLPAVREARTAWLSVAGQGEGLVISIDLDDPADKAAQDAAADAVERAAALVAEDTRFAIDVTFPGEAEPDPVADSVAASAVPFYRRA